tara:strand:+ start:215 stop:484 length:270 start_codon:yes stop_codon:yes gene_type:complete
LTTLLQSAKRGKTMKNVDLLNEKMHSAKSRIEKLIGVASAKMMVKNALAKKCSRKDSGNRETGISDSLQDARLSFRKSDDIEGCTQKCC